jgi:hypothetical protein
MQHRAEQSSYSCATLRYLTDPVREITVPVGVILWEAESHWYAFRFPQNEERVLGVAIQTAQPHLDMAQQQIEAWLRADRLPYAEPQPKRLTRAWWEHVQKLLRFRVRVEDIRAVDCQDPAQEINALFEAIVHPVVSERKQAQRIDGAVTRALGTQLTLRYQKGQVPGFGGRKVAVRRCAETPEKIVIVDAVNLAASTAETDADALFGRLSRIREAAQERPVQFVLGYIASPGGLNGEKALKEFLETRLSSPMRDLNREDAQFRAEAEKAIA